MVSRASSVNNVQELTRNAATLELVAEAVIGALVGNTSSSSTKGGTMINPPAGAHLVARSGDGDDEELGDAGKEEEGGDDGEDGFDRHGDLLEWNDETTRRKKQAACEVRKGSDFLKV